jgi:hypothetical protein
MTGLWQIVKFCKCDLQSAQYLMTGLWRIMVFLKCNPQTMLYLMTAVWQACVIIWKNPSPKSTQWKYSGGQVTGGCLTGAGQVLKQQCWC